MKRILAPRAPAAGERVVLAAAEGHHLTRVLRLGPGDLVLAFDGAGRESEAAVASVGPNGVELVGTGAVRRVASGPPLHLLLALPKGPAADLAVRMANELGVTDFHPVLAERTVATGDRGDRWLRIAESAARQCGRPDLPEIHDLRTLDASFDAVPPGVARWIAAPGADPGRPDGGAAAVWVGPEGGWTTAELRLALDRGCGPLRLGRWTLRADTAVAAALAILAA